VAFQHEHARSEPGPAAPRRRHLLTSAAAGLVIGAGVVAAGAVVAPKPAEAAMGGSSVTVCPSGDTIGATDAAALNAWCPAGRGA
jgi:hypothetical protein